MVVKLLSAKRKDPNGDSLISESSHGVSDVVNLGEGDPTKCGFQHPLFNFVSNHFSRFRRSAGLCATTLSDRRASRDRGRIPYLHTHDRRCEPNYLLYPAFSELRVQNLHQSGIANYLALIERFMDPATRPGIDVIDEVVDIFNQAFLFK